MGQRGVAAHEAVGLAQVRGQRAALLGPVAGQRPGAAQRRGAALAGADRQQGEQVVAQVLADLGRVHGHRDAVRAQSVRRADAGEHQQPGGVDRAGAQQHLRARRDPLDPRLGPELDADRATAGEQDPVYLRPGAHDEVGPVRRGPQVAVRGGPAPPVPLRHHRRRHPLRVRLVRAVRARQPHLPAGVEERGGQRARVEQPPHRHRAAGALVRAGVFGVLDRAQQRQHRRRGPAVAGQAGPFVVVGRVPAHPHHGIDGRRAAQGAPVRPVHAAPAEARLRLGAVGPVDR